MRPFLKLIVGLLIVSLIGLAAVSVDGMPWSAASAERSLQSSASSALGVSAAEWAAIRVEGQKVVLSGEAPSAASRDALIERIAHAEWDGGLVVGGVTTVDATGLSVAPALPDADPFVWIAEYEDGAIQFSGYAPSAEARDTIVRLAARIFSEIDTSGDLEVASGAPVGETDWVEATFISLRALSMLEHGVVHASDENFSLSGETSSEDNAAAIASVMESIGKGLNGSADITVTAPPPLQENPVEESAVPPPDEPVGDAAIATAEPVIAEPACTAPLQTAIDAKRIGFSSARTDIDIPSRAHLREIAALLNNCPKARLFITGHTDASGNAARNMQLSGYRADAVRAFLTSVGAPADRLSARGVGASQPLVSNETPEGREQNRRIEIEILSMDE